MSNTIAAEQATNGNNNPRYIDPTDPGWHDWCRDNLVRHAGLACCEIEFALQKFDEGDFALAVQQAASAALKLTDSARNAAEAAEAVGVPPEARAAAEAAMKDMADRVAFQARFLAQCADYAAQ